MFPRKNGTGKSQRTNYPSDLKQMMGTLKPDGDVYFVTIIPM